MEEKVTRNSKGQWVKGANGLSESPLSKIPRFDPNTPIRDMEEVYIDSAGLVFQQLLKTILDPKTSPAARVSAIKEYNDRAFGKSAQAVKIKHDNTGGLPEIDMSGLPIEVLKLIVDKANDQLKK